MKFNTTALISNIKYYFTKTIGAMLIVGMIWQGFVLGIDSAFATGGLNGNITTSLLASSSMSKQVSNKMDEAKDKAELAKKSAESNMLQTKKSVKSNAKKAEASVKESTKKAKNFFGF